MVSSDGGRWLNHGLFAAVANEYEWPGYPVGRRRRKSLHAARWLTPAGRLGLRTFATIGAGSSFSNSAVFVFPTFFAVLPRPTVVSTSVRVVSPVFPCASIGLGSSFLHDSLRFISNSSIPRAPLDPQSSPPDGQPRVQSSIENLCLRSAYGRPPKSHLEINAQSI